MLNADILLYLGPPSGEFMLEGIWSPCFCLDWFSCIANYQGSFFIFLLFSIPPPTPPQKKNVLLNTLSGLGGVGWGWLLPDFVELIQYCFLFWTELYGYLFGTILGGQFASGIFTSIFLFYSETQDQGHYHPPLLVDMLATD